MTPISPQAGLLRYVRQQGRGTQPSGGLRPRLAGDTYIRREKSNFKFGIYLYLCRNFIVFVLNLVYLYVKLRSFKLFLKFSKFVT